MSVIRPWWAGLASRSWELVLTGATFFVNIVLRCLGLATTFMEAVSQRVEGRKVAAALLAARSAKSANRWRVAFEAAPMGMARVGLDGRIQAVNSSLCNLLGEPERALLGRRLGGLVYPDDLEALAGPGNPGKTKGVAKAEVRLVCSGGRLLWCEVASTLVTTPSGRPDHVLAYVVDITRHKRSQAALRDLATRDPLSGLANRRWFELQLAHHLRACDEDGARGALLVMDLDNFKNVNDTLGHQAGDRLIIEAAVSLRRHLRDHDLVARLGGDEFAVILRDGDSSAAESVARKLVLAVRDEVFAGAEAAVPVPEGGAAEAAAGAPQAEAGAARPEPEVTVSIGVAPFEMLEGASAKDVIRIADAALYEVKRSGRNGYALAGSTDGPHFARQRAGGVPDLSDPTDLRAPMASSGSGSRHS